MSSFDEGAFDSGAFDAFAYVGATISFNAVVNSNAFGAAVLDYTLRNIRLHNASGVDAAGAFTLAYSTGVGYLSPVFRTGWAERFALDISSVVGTGTWSSFALDATAIFRTGCYLHSVLDVFVDYPRPFTYTGWFPAILPATVYTGAVGVPPIVDFRVRALAVTSLPYTYGIGTPPIIDFRVRNLTTSSIDPFHAGWLSCIGFREQYVTFCEGGGMDTLAIGEDYQDIFTHGMEVRESLTAQMEGIAPPELQWPIIEYRTKSVRVPSIQSGLSNIGVVHASAA